MKIVNRYSQAVLFDDESEDTDIRSAVLSAIAEKADLSGADLSKVNLLEADLSKADLRWAYLRGADLRWADLSRANLFEAYLCGANLCGADLRGADLRWADLSGADLCGADLRGADLHWADLTGADLCAADLTGANLTGARGARGASGASGASGSDLFGANLFGAYLTSIGTDAALRGANSSEAGLGGAELGCVEFADLTMNHNSNSGNLFFEKFGDPYIDAIKRKVLEYFLEEFGDYLASKCSNDMSANFIDSLNLTKEQESKIILEIYNDHDDHPVRSKSIYQIPDYMWLSYIKGIM